MSLFGKNQRDDEPEVVPAGTRPVSAPRGRPPVAEAPREPERPARRYGATMANIGKSITIKGDLTGEEDLQIEGNVEGRIDLPGNQLTVGAEGKVKAEIHAKAVVIVGHVTGNVSAVDRIEIQATGVVDGDVKAPRLVVQEGAILNGSIEMGASSGSATGKSTAPSAAATPPRAALGGSAA